MVLDQYIHRLGFWIFGTLGALMGMSQATGQLELLSPSTFRPIQVTVWT